MRRRRPLLTLWSVKKFWILFEDVGPRLRHTSLAPGNGLAGPPDVSRKCSGCFARSFAASVSTRRANSWFNSPPNRSRIHWRRSQASLRAASRVAPCSRSLRATCRGILSEAMPRMAANSVIGRRTRDSDFTRRMGPPVWFPLAGRQLSQKSRLEAADYDRTARQVNGHVHACAGEPSTRGSRAGRRLLEPSRGGHWYRITRKATAYMRPRSRRKRKRASQ